MPAVMRCRLYPLTLRSGTVADMDPAGGRDFPQGMPWSMSELAQLRLDLGDVVTACSQATDDLYRSLAGASADDERELILQASVDIAEAGRTAARAWAGVRTLLRALEAHSEALAADERAAEADCEHPAPF